MTMYSTTRLLVRLGLLLTALLQFGGAAVGPWLHQAAVASASLDAPQPSEPDGPSAPTPHDEQSCVVCHALGSAMLIAAAAPAPAPSPVPADLASDGGASPRPLGRAAPQARAPPLT